MESDNCLICYSNCDTKLNCGHYYHLTCFKDYVINCNKSKCCYCFKEFNDTDFTLIKYYPKLNTLLFKAIETKNLDKVFELIELGADIHAKNNRGDTTLMYALEFCKDSEVIYKLIELGADTSNLNNDDKQKLNEILSQK